MLLPKTPSTSDVLTIRGFLSPGRKTPGLILIKDSQLHLTLQLSDMGLMELAGVSRGGILSSKASNRNRHDLLRA